MYLLLIPLIFLLAIAALILVPFRLCLDLKIDGFSVTGFYKVKWFGLTIRRAELFGPREDEDIKRLEDKKKTRIRTVSTGKDVKKDNADRRSRFDRQRFLKDPRLFIDALPSLFRILKDLMGTVHIERLLLNITIGLDDPANTAVLSGYLWSMASLVSKPSVIIRIDPYFGGDRLIGSVNAELWSRLLWVFVAFINALREKPIRRLLKEMSWKSFRDSRNKPQMRRPLWGPKGKGNGNGV